MKYVALICARGGSKGLPHKNILPLNGLPLISWSIKLVQKMENISRVIVSTDSSKIAQIAKEDGAEVPFIRPEYLAKDDSPEWLVWRHALNFLKSENYEVDGLIIVPPTSPLRNQEDINNCINEFEKGSIDSVITAVGLVDSLLIMPTAVILAIILMLIASGPVAEFVSRHPTVKMLAFSFLLLIGTTLVADGSGFHRPKGYLYAAMAFSAFVEMLNTFTRRRRNRLKSA